MLKIFSLFVTIILIVLFPPAVLAFISNNAVPGDLTYPIKRKLEDGILVLASVNPTTKAYFQINRSDRRFKEATALIKRNTNSASSLNELTDQVSFTIDDLKKITDNTQKKQLAQQLSQSITGYDQTLAQYQKDYVPPEANINPSNPPTQSNPSATVEPSSIKPSPSAVQLTNPSPSVFHTPSPSSSSSVPPPNDQQKQIDEARRKLEQQQRELEEIKRQLAAQQEAERLARQNSTGSGGETQPSPSADLGLEDDTNPTLDFNGLKDALSKINIDDLSSLVP